MARAFYLGWYFVLTPGEQSVKRTLGFRKHTLARTLFADTVIGRSLRRLLAMERQDQSVFWREYHQMSTRTTGTRSSFSNNVGRFLLRWESPGRGWRTGGWIGPDRYSSDTPLRVIEKSLDTRPLARKRNSAVTMRTVNVLSWAGPTRVQIVDMMSDRDLQWAYESMDKQMLDGGRTRPDIDQADIEAWVATLKTAITARTKDDPRAPVVRMLRTACVAGFGMPYDYDYFSMHYQNGETSNDALYRLFVAARPDFASDEECVRVMIHG